jgi:hypothetical protein
MKKLLLILSLLTTILFATTPTQENVAKLYIATFERAPDAAGLDYWVNESGLSLEEIAQSFFDQRETRLLYPESYSNDKFIDEVYSNLFNRAADKEGKAYWLPRLEDGTIHRSVFILAIINGALGDDAVILENKTTVGLAFAEAGMDNYRDAVDIMRGITADPQTVEDALKKYGLDPDNPNPTPPNPGPTPPNPNPTPPQPNPGAKKMGWYLRTVVEADKDGKRYVHSSAGVFGGLTDSTAGKDRHDIPAMGTAILRVIFVHPEWEEEDGEYFSDYRRYTEGIRREVWTFQVRNDKTVDLSDAPLKIRLEGPYDAFMTKNGIVEKPSQNTARRDSIQLVDIDNDKVYTYDELQYASLSIDGKHTRNFRWVLGGVQEEDYELPARQAALASPAPRAAAASMEVAPAGKFGLPPSE